MIGGGVVILELRNDSRASFVSILLSNLSSSISQIDGQTLKIKYLVQNNRKIHQKIRPRQVQKHGWTKKFPLLSLFDSQGEDAFKSKTKYGESQVPIVRVFFHVNYPENKGIYSNFNFKRIFREKYTRASMVKREDFINSIHV